jgi:hypothetical protein
MPKRACKEQTLYHDGAIHKLQKSVASKAPEVVLKNFLVVSLLKGCLNYEKFTLNVQIMFLIKHPPRQ